MSEKYDFDEQLKKLEKSLGDADKHFDNFDSALNAISQERKNKRSTDTNFAKWLYFAIAFGVVCILIFY